MDRSPVRTLVVAGAVLLLAASGSWAQEAVTVKLQPTGLIQIMRGDVELGTIELSAHGVEWKHAPQKSATAQVSDLPGQAGKRFVGTLPIPTADGGAIKYSESVKLLPQGLALEYDLAMTKAMKLDGVQVSLCLPVAQYGGKELVIAQPEDEPRTVTLPAEQQGDAFQVWTGEGPRIEVAKGTSDAIALELRAATNIVVHDLRKWEWAVFEVRLPAIMEGEGREVAADDRLHLDLTVTFAGPVKLVGP